MIVMKFGGSSVANREQIEKVMAIVAAHQPRAPMVVVSAHKGITDALIDAARAAASGVDAGERVIAKQSEIASSLDCSTDLLAPLFAEMRDLLRGIRLVKELSPRSLDYISSFGERMSSRCIADFFARNGLPSLSYDAWDLGFVTDANFGRARPTAGFEARVREAVNSPIPAGMVPVVTGFVGMNERGEITTVGRNGSDLTASLFGAGLGAQEVQIWSDTDGVMSADPSVVPTARSIPTMRFDEAAELAYFGSRVLHPATLLPAMGSDIPVRVMNTNRPGHPGTVITGKSSDAADGPIVTSIAYKERQAVLTLGSLRMFEQVGFLAEVFAVIGRHHADIDMIATSEVSVSISSYNVAALESAMEELQRFGQCQLLRNKTIMSIVGQRLPHTRGIGGRILECIAEAGVNVEMMTFGMGSINFTVVIDDADIAKVVPVLHRRLFEA
ncbi:MAG: aspartate kinase [Deltaproteobacteria bacterium]|nr:aspartate kinase [Deltaproteobacteria bacterium]